MLATFVIFLREGIEASMIVAVLLAYLDKIGQRRHFRDIFIGCALAIVLATGGGVVAYVTIRTYAGSRVQTIFETCTYLLAAAVLTYMTFWMRVHARTISRELRERTERALDRGERFGLGFLAFQAVGREGLDGCLHARRHLRGRQRLALRHLRGRVRPRRGTRRRLLDLPPRQAPRLGPVLLGARGGPHGLRRRPPRRRG